MSALTTVVARIRPMPDLSAKRRPEVLLVVAAPWIGIARVPRVLHDAGCRVVLLCPPDFYAARSAHVDELLPAPQDVGAVLEQLKRLLAARHFDWVILGDGEILGAAVDHAGPWRRGWFPIDGDSEAARLLVSKTAFAQVMSQADLPIPRSEATTGAGAAAAAARIGYPVIVKPDQSSAGCGLIRADDEQALGQWPQDAPVAIQAFVDGRVGSTAVLFVEGTPCCWMSSFKDEVHPKPFGPSSVRRYVDFPPLEPLLGRVGQKLRLTGLCGLDWILPAGRDEPLFIELNGRPPPWLHLHRHFGVDFPGAIRAMLSGSPRVIRPPATVPEPCVRMFPQDAMRAVAEGDWPGFMRGFLGGNDAPRDEPRLLRSLRRTLCRRAYKRLRR